MVLITEEMIKQFENMVEKINEQLKKTFENIHQGYQTENLVRFLKAQDGNVSNAYEMLIDCLSWRIENKIDDILANPNIPVEFYRLICNSQLVGMSGYSNDSYPVFTIGPGLNTLDKTSIDYYVQSHIQINEYQDRVILPRATKRLGRYRGTCIVIFDMTGLRLFAIYQIIKNLLIKNPKDLAFLEKEGGLASLVIIGIGGCGVVYKATLPRSNGLEIGIKKIPLPLNVEEPSQEESRLMNKRMRQIGSEIRTTSLIRHRNLLPLFAHMPRPDYHYLVYEYMKNGSPQDVLQQVSQERRELD
ncbi:SEC14 cytosolic factor-like [Olea europaea subsp. europaea]|uniref:SEC14 cytosolic factor-like n=1 Tax=Olea europaea subsp. europaea TaxID=158383 RepID=A0A8S0Q2M2_OLEEU|nr:SEC14 cytosolic factor-like [Olea europaea subsp. europaea]